MLMTLCTHVYILPNSSCGKLLVWNEKKEKHLHEHMSLQKRERKEIKISKILISYLAKKNSKRLDTVSKFLMRISKCIKNVTKYQKCINL